MGIERLSEFWPEWKISDKLGEGAFGTVYKAVDEEAGFPVYSAIKVLSIPSSEAELDALEAEGMSEAESRRYFKEIVDDFVNEIKLMHALKGAPNIVSVEAFKIAEKTEGIGWDIFIRMELLTSFKDYAKSHSFNEDDIIKLGIDLASALEICKVNNIIHRDIKPANIFADKFGNFKLGDFGIAKELEKTAGALSSKGTFSYMAPEVANGERYDSSVDTYSLGLVLYSLCNNNRPPFIAADNDRIGYNDRKQAIDRRLAGEALPAPMYASEELSNIILVACAYDPKKRFGNPTAFKNALISYRDNRGNVSTSAEQTADPEKTVAVRHTPEPDLTMTQRVRKSAPEGKKENEQIVSVPNLGKKKKRNIIAIALVIAVCLIGVIVFLNLPRASGDGWSLTFGGVLTVSVNGDMEDYSYNSDTDRHSVPWEDEKQSIKKVVIKPGVTSIGDNAFACCRWLKRAIISDTVISIGNEAFLECNSLKRVKMSDSLTFIGDKAFSGCHPLKKITIPDTVTSIGDNAFHCCAALESITIPDSVVSIGEGAFSQSIELKNVVISSGVSSIGEGAFDWCPSLVSITVDENNNFYSSEDGVLFDKNKTVLIRCPEGKESDKYIVPDSVISIGDYSFESCDNIKSIVIPDSIVSIGNEVFSCGSLERITIPASVTSIGTWERGSCHSLVDITVDENNNFYSSEDGVLFDKNKTAILKYPMSKTEYEYIIPDSVTSIGYDTFYECDNLKRVVIPDSVISIGDQAFSDCSSLESIIIPNSVTSIGEFAFNWCFSLKSITIPASVTSIGDHAFNMCTALENITILASVSSIGEDAFNDCDNLSITCPAGSYAEQYAIENNIPYINN